LDGRVAGLHLLRRHVHHRAELPEGLPYADEALRQIRLEEPADLVADVAVRLQPEGLEQAPVGTEDVHGQGHRGSLDVLEQQGGAAGLVDPVDDLADVQVGVDLDLDALEITIALKSPEQGAKIVVSHAVQFVIPTPAAPPGLPRPAPRFLHTEPVPWPRYGAIVPPAATSWGTHHES